MGERRAPRVGPGVEAPPEGLPEAGASACDDEGDAAFAEEDAGGGLEKEGAEAPAAHPALPLGAEELGPHSHEVGRDEGEEKLGLVGGEGVVGHGRSVDDAVPVLALGAWGGGEGRRDGLVAVTEVGLGRAALAVAVEQGLGALLFHRGTGEEEEVVEEEVLLLVGTLHHDQDDAAGTRPRLGPIGKLMKPGSALGRWTSGWTAEEGLGDPVQGLVRAEPEDVGDRLLLKGLEEGRVGESGIGPEPDARNEALEPAKEGQDEIEPAVGGVHVAGAKPRPEKEAPQHAGHQGMVAARPVMAVVGAPWLMAMDLVGQRVQVQGDLPASGGEHGLWHLAKDETEAAPVVLAAKHPHEPGERRLRAQSVRDTAPGAPEGAIAPPLRDCKAKRGVVPEKGDVVLVLPPLGQRQNACPNQLHEGMPGPGRIAWVLQVSSHQPGQPQSLRELPQEHHPGIRREPLGPSLHPDRLVAIQPKQRTLNFTHGVFSGSVMKVWSRHPHLIAA